MSHPGMTALAWIGWALVMLPYLLEGRRKGNPRA